eukprot:scaffold86727_cov60-Phaeocystis_antarctica.AAC.3
MILLKSLRFHKTKLPITYYPRPRVVGAHRLRPHLHAHPRLQDEDAEVVRRERRGAHLTQHRLDPRAHVALIRDAARLAPAGDQLQPLRHSARVGIHKITHTLLQPPAHRRLGRALREPRAQPSFHSSRARSGCAHKASRMALKQHMLVSTCDASRRLKSCSAGAG